MIKLIASDMDGTLLDQNSEVPPETFELIEELYKRGVHFVASSGRRYDTLRWLFEPVADKIDYVASLGTQVYVENEVIDREVFSSASIRKLFELTSEFDCIHLVVYDRTHTYLLDDQSSFVRELDKDILADYERKLVFVSGIVDQVPKDVDFVAATIACPGTEEDMERCRQKVAAACPDVYTMSVVPQWFDVLPKGVSKLTGFETLLERTGISPEEVLVFGDGENDVEILSKVPHSVAVANAIPEVKQVAKHHVGASADDGVAHALLELVRATKAGETPRFMMEN